MPAALLPTATGAFTLVCMSALRTPIAGIPIPNSTLASDATQFVQDASSSTEPTRPAPSSSATTPEIPRYKQPELTAEQRAAVLPARGAGHE